MHNHVMADNHQNEDLKTRRRREQVRLAQQRRRERLARGAKSQVNLFLSKHAIARLDALALLWGVERQHVIERLLGNLELQAHARVDDLPALDIDARVDPGTGSAR